MCEMIESGCLAAHAKLSKLKVLNISIQNHSKNISNRSMKLSYFYVKTNSDIPDEIA